MYTVFGSLFTETKSCERCILSNNDVYIPEEFGMKAEVLSTYITIIKIN